MQQALYVFAGHRGPFGQLFLNILRAAIKAAFILCLGMCVAVAVVGWACFSLVLA